MMLCLLQSCSLCHSEVILRNDKLRAPICMLSEENGRFQRAEHVH